MGSIKCKNVERVFLLEACANEDFAYVLGVQCEEVCEETSTGQSHFAWEVW